MYCSVSFISPSEVFFSSSLNLIENDFSPIDPDGCDIDRIHSKAYLHHLFKAQELLAMQIASIHNLAFYLRLVTDARQHIIAGDFVQWKRSVIEQLGQRR